MPKTTSPTLGLGVLSAIGGSLLLTTSATAQIVPDQTLGTESSVVNGGAINGLPADLINGGAIRDANLFHSFQEFNVQELQRVYFSNPDGILHILSRVTGSNASNILGTLGVDGPASLYLINPNGIVFGPNAQLDVNGSFLASTSDRFTFVDGSEFRATNPNDAPLVTVSVAPGVQFGEDAPQPIFSEANLTAGQDLTLSAGAVTSTGAIAAPQGQVEIAAVAGDAIVQDVTAQSAVLSATGNLVLEESQLQTTGDLSLLAEDTVRIRDSEENSFRAIAGQDLIIQGNQEIDILALSHLEEAPLQAGRDLTLVSDGNISGDSHFLSGRNYSIRNLSNETGDFYSYYDPIISADGDVIFNNYTGLSLKIEATGSIIGDGHIRIIGNDENIPGNSEDIDTLRSSAALILRAGLEATDLDNPPPGSQDFFNPEDIACIGTECSSPSSTTGITANGTDFSLGGELIPPGSIRVASINIPSDTPDRGPVILESRSGNIQIIGNIPGSPGFSVSAQSFSADASGDIAIAGGVTLRRDDDQPSGNISIGQEIEPEDVTLGWLSTRQGGTANGGDIFIRNTGILTITGAFNREVGTTAVNDVENISDLPDTAENRELDNFAAIATQSIIGNGGSIDISANGGINIRQFITEDGSGFRAAIVSANDDTGLGNRGTEDFYGNGGDITLGADSGAVSVGDIRSFTEGNGRENNDIDGIYEGNAGFIRLTARDQITTQDIESRSLNGDGRFGGGFDTSGDITIISSTGGIDTTAGTLDSSTRSGDAGDVILRAAGEIVTGNIFSRSTRDFDQDGNLLEGGNSDTITITSDTRINLSGVVIRTDTRGGIVYSGNTENLSDLGNITINAPAIEIENSTVRTDTFNDSIPEDNPDTAVNEAIGRRAGSVEIGTFEYAPETETLITLIDTRIGTDTHGFHGDNQIPGDAGSITIGNASIDRVEITGTSESSDANGSATQIRAESHAHLNLERNGDPEGTTYSGYDDLRFIDEAFDAGSGGSIQIEGASVLVNSATISASTFGSGQGGNVTIDGQSIRIQNNSSVIAETSGATDTSAGGNVFVGVQSNLTTPDILDDLITQFANNAISIDNSSQISTTTGKTQLVVHRQLLNDPNHPSPTNSESFTLPYTFDPGNPSIPGDLNPGLDPEFGLADAGDIFIGNSTTNEITVTQNSTITATSVGKGSDAGNAGQIIFIYASSDDSDSINVTNIPSTIDGVITISDSEIATSVSGGDLSGNIDITGGTVNITNARVNASAAGSFGSSAGSIRILTTSPNPDSATSSLSLSNSEIQAVTFDQATAGSIDLAAYNGGSLNISDSSTVSSSTLGSGNSSQVQLLGQALSITGGSNIQAQSIGSGRPGSILVDISGDIVIAGNNSVGQVSELSTFSGRDADLTPTTEISCVGCITVSSQGHLQIADRGRINAVTATQTAEQGGSIDVTVQDLTLSNGGQIVTSSLPGALAQAGNIELEIAGNLSISGFANAFLSEPAFQNPILLETFGNVELQTNAAGLQSILVKTGDGSFTVPELEPILNLPGGNLSNLGLGSAQEGSAVVFDLGNASGGVTLNGIFLTDENTPTSFNDFGFVGAEAAGATALADTCSVLTNCNSFRTADNAAFDEGVSFPAVVFSPGSSRSLGVVDVQDPVVDSAVEFTNITINSPLLISDPITASNETFNSGIFAEATTANAGDITINLTGNNSTVNVSNAGRISNSTVSGSGRDITLSGAGALTVQNGLITTATESGEAGSISINRGGSAAQSVNLSGVIPETTSSQAAIGGIVAQAINGGDAGDIFVNTQDLFVSDQAEISARSVDLDVDLDGPDSDGISPGSAGSVDILASNILLNNQAQIAATTEAGEAGSISITGNGIPAQNLIVAGSSEISVSADAGGRAGGIDIDSNNVLVQSAVLANDDIDFSTFNFRDALLEAILPNSASVPTVNFDIDERDGVPPQDIIDERSAIRVDSRFGLAGSLTIQTDLLGLSGGLLEATSGASEEGTNSATITLNLSRNPSLENFVILANESLISANALGDADGGNINVSADLVFAQAPLGRRGSDIIANAERGDGGLITVDTLAVFGLELRDRRTPLNDVTATSISGSAGSVLITSLGVDPSQGLTEVPLAFVDATDLVGDRCAAFGGEGSQFTVAGRGGVPANPVEPLAPVFEGTDWVTLDEEEGPADQSRSIELTPTVLRLPTTAQGQCLRAWQVSLGVAD